PRRIESKEAAAAAGPRSSEPAAGGAWTAPARSDPGRGAAASPGSASLPVAPVQHGPRRVEVLPKSALPNAARLEARPAAPVRWRLVLYGFGVVFLLLLIVSFSVSHQQIRVEDNPLARIHTDEAPRDNLFQKTREEEAAQLRQSLVAEAKG